MKVVQWIYFFTPHDAHHEPADEYDAQARQGKEWGWGRCCGRWVIVAKVISKKQPPPGPTQ